MKWMLLMKCIRIEMWGWSPLQRCVYVTCLWQCIECIEPSILYYHNLQIANRLAILEEIQFLQPASTICLNWCQIFWQLAVGSCCRPFILIALRLFGTVLVFPTARRRSQRANESRRCLPYEPAIYSYVPLNVFTCGLGLFHFAAVADFPKHRACQFVWVYCTHCSGYDLGKRPGRQRPAAVVVDADKNCNPQSGE